MKILQICLKKFCEFPPWREHNGKVGQNVAKFKILCALLDTTVILKSPILFYQICVNKSYGVTSKNFGK